MELLNTVAALAALAHEGRLEIYRMLVKAGPDGLVVGKIASKVKMPGATLSFHLAQLKNAGLIQSRREGRQLVQTADFARMNDLVGFLTENCCGGNPSLCAPAAQRKKKSP